MIVGASLNASLPPRAGACWRQVVFISGGSLALMASGATLPHTAGYPMGATPFVFQGSPRLYFAAGGATAILGILDGFSPGAEPGATLI